MRIRLRPARGIVAVVSACDRQRIHQSLKTLRIRILIAHLLQVRSHHIGSGLILPILVRGGILALFLAHFLSALLGNLGKSL